MILVKLCKFYLMRTLSYVVSARAYIKQIAKYFATRASDLGWVIHFLSGHTSRLEERQSVEKIV